MIIRRASKTDIEAIIKLLCQVLDIHNKGRPDIFKANSRKYNDNELKEIIFNEAKPIFVAEEDGEVFGYCFCVITEMKNDNILKDIKSLYIDDLCVDEKARGKGVGKSLYEYVREYAKKEGCYNITLNVWECNASAKAFYEKMGLLSQKTIMEDII